MIKVINFINKLIYPQSPHTHTNTFQVYLGGGDIGVVFSQTSQTLYKM